MGLPVGLTRQSFEIPETQFGLLGGLAFSLFYAIMGLRRNREYNIVDLDGMLTALITSLVFFLFSRRSITNRFIKQVPEGEG